MFPPKACRPTYLLKSKFSDFWKTRNLPQQHCCGELSLRFPPLMHEARTVLVESSHFTLIPSSLAFTYKKNSFSFSALSSSHAGTPTRCPCFPPLHLPFHLRARARERAGQRPWGLKEVKLLRRFLCGKRAGVGGGMKAAGCISSPEVLLEQKNS